jgi:very-short-patch-repair endonuclease
LEAIGVNSSSVVWRVARAGLFPSLRGVFVVGHSASVELGAETEALLSVRDGAAVSHWSAAALWGLWTPGPREIEVVVDMSEGAVNPGVHVHRSRTLERKDVWIRKRLPVTSPARTLLDIAPTATDRQLELVFDRGIVERVMKPAHVADVLDRAGGHRGRKRLRVLLERELGGPTITKSEAEDLLLALIRTAGLPAPHVNARVGNYEIDLYWPDARFGIEMDSWRFHSTRTRFERDRSKDNALRRIEIEVMRVTWWQIQDAPYVLVADVTRELTRRGL